MKRMPRKRSSPSSASQRRVALGLIVVAIIAVSIAAPLAWRRGLPRPRATPEPAARVSTLGENVVIPLSDIHSAAKFYVVTSGQADCRFFVMRTSTGGYWTGIDACPKCGHAHRGYRQDAGQLVCNQCERRFEIDRLDDLVEQCLPVRVANSVQSDELVIRVNDLQAAWHTIGTK